MSVRDDEVLMVLADQWRAKYGGDWDFEVRDHRFHEVTDQGDGEHDGAVVFRVRPSKVLVFGDDHGQTAYRF